MQKLSSKRSLSITSTDNTQHTDMYKTAVSAFSLAISLPTLELRDIDM